MSVKRSELADVFRAIVALEAVVKSGGFTAAARDLGVAQSAVSRHVGRLERLAGRPLLSRRGRRIAPTETGLQFAQAASAGLDLLGEAVAQLNAAEDARSVSIGSSHDVAALWLLPKLDRFRARHPDVSIELSVADSYRSLERNDIDVSLRFGRGDWPEAIATRLFDEEVIAVCAPSLLARFPSLRTLRSPRDLLNAPLIHVAPSRGIDWYVWMRALGVRPPAAATMRYPTYQTSLEAAVRGEGVALFWLHLNDALFARGQLERLGHWKVGSGEALYALHKADPKPIVREVVSFLTQ